MGPLRQPRKRCVVARSEKRGENRVAGNIADIVEGVESSQGRTSLESRGSKKKGFELEGESVSLLPRSKISVKKARRVKSLLTPQRL